MKTPQNGPAFKAPSPEVVKVKTKYALTISPNDEHQYWKHEMDSRVDAFHTTMLFKVYHLAGCADIDLRMEVSSGGRLHCHGWISFDTQDDIARFYIQYIHQMQSWCTYTIIEIEDDTIWTAYVNKQKWFRYEITTKRAKQRYDMVPTKHKGVYQKPIDEF